MSENIKITVEHKVEYRLPILPNFICVPDGGKSVDVASFTDDQLREIGQIWTEALIRKAQKRRHDKAK